MSETTGPNPVADPRPSASPAGLGTVAYRIAVVVLLGVNAWYLSRLPGPDKPTGKPALALPGSTWRLDYELDLNGNKERRAGVLEFGTDGSVAERGSGRGTFEIVGAEEISLDPKGLFSWHASQKEIRADRWIVSIAGDNLVLQRKSPPNDRVVLHKVWETDAQTKEILRALGDIRTELQMQGNARRSENSAIQRELQLLREKK